MVQAWYGYDERYIKTINNMKQFIEAYQIEQDNELKEICLKEIFLKTWKNRVKTR